MKKILFIAALLLSLSFVCTAEKATIYIRPDGLKGKFVQEDSLILYANPILKKGTVTYKDSTQLATIIQGIDDYFADKPLTKGYRISFLNKGEVGRLDVGHGKTPAFKFSENENVNQLAVGIICLLAALVCMLVGLLTDKIPFRFLANLLNFILLLGILAFGGLGIVLLISLGFKILLMVLGPTIVIGAILLFLLGGGSGSSYSSSSRASSRSSSRTASSAQSSSSSNARKGGYSVAGRHFDTYGAAKNYAQQFPYMNEGWIQPD